MPPVWLSQLALVDAGDGKRFTLAADLAVSLDRETMLLAPAGMVTDGASIPRLFWRLVGSPWTGRYRRSAVIHDAAYQGWLVVSRPYVRTREWADGVFLALMASDRVSCLHRWIIYRAVRACGGWAWQPQDHNHEPE